jgi:hypothetical protein
LNKNAAEKEATDDIIDDDDDDDLEPIETLEAPIKCNVAYVRDFIETLSEDKPYEERLATFSALPNVVKHQIKHEHPQVSDVFQLPSKALTKTGRAKTFVGMFQKCMSFLRNFCVFSSSTLVVGLILFLY